MWNRDILFVHGAWEGPWIYRAWIAYFAGEGWSARAVTLPGHGPGENAKGYGLAGYVEALEEAVWDEARTVLVGHSMGGWVVMKYLESHQVAASVLCSPVPAAGLPRRTVKSFMTMAPGLSLKALLLGIPPELTDAGLVRRTCFTEQTEEDLVSRFAGESVPESPTALREMVLMPLRIPGWPKIRSRRLARLQKGRSHLIVASEADALIRPSELEATAGLLGAEMLRLGTSPHCFTLTPENLNIAATIDRWLTEKLGGDQVAQ